MNHLTKTPLKTELLRIEARPKAGEPFTDIHNALRDVKQEPEERSTDASLVHVRDIFLQRLQRATTTANENNTYLATSIRTLLNHIK